MSASMSPQHHQAQKSSIRLASFSPLIHHIDVPDYPLSSKQKYEVIDSQSRQIQTLSQRNEDLSHLVDNLPNGVVVLDEKGLVSQANKLAIQLLGEPLEGELWRSIITRSFKPREDDGHEVSLHNGRRVKLEITSLPYGQLIVMTDLTETRQLQARVSHLQRVSA